MVRAWGWVTDLGCQVLRQTLGLASPLTLMLRCLFEFLQRVQIAKHVRREVLLCQFVLFNDSHFDVAKQWIDLVLPLPQCLFGKTGERLSIDRAQRLPCTRGTRDRDHGTLMTSRFP